MIRDTLFQMTQSNQRARSHLEGGAFCASFEVPPSGVPWVQAKNGVINAYYPFEIPPSLLFEQRGFGGVPSINFPAWEPKKFVTVTFGKLDIEDYTIFIDKLFRELYDLPATYIVSTDIFDMR
jgi:hypothetical protein